MNDILERLNDSEQYVDAIDDAITEIEHLRAENAALSWARWVPVSERLPENPGHYLVATTSTYLFVSDTNGIYQTYFYPDNIKGKEFSGDAGVTHWRPLPLHPDAARAQGE